MGQKRARGGIDLGEGRYGSESRVGNGMNLERASWCGPIECWFGLGDGWH